MEVVFLSVAALAYILVGGALFMFFTREAIVGLFIAKSFGEEYREVWASAVLAFVGLSVFSLGIVQLVWEIVS